MSLRVVPVYAASARVAKELGYEKIQTYILDVETGTSLKASGWELEVMSTGGGDGWHSRPGRRNDQPKNTKQRWVKVLNQSINRETVEETAQKKQDVLF